MGSASTWLTAPMAHEWVLLRQQQPYGRMSRRLLQRLRTAASGHDPHAKLVSRSVLAARAHAKRYRAAPVCGSRLRWSGTDFAELQGSPQIYPVDNRHGFEVYRPIANFPAQKINFPASGSRDIHTVAHRERYEAKGLRYSVQKHWVGEGVPWT